MTYLRLASAVCLEEVRVTPRCRISSNVLQLLCAGRRGEQVRLTESTALLRAPHCYIFSFFFLDSLESQSYNFNSTCDLIGGNLFHFVRVTPV